MDSQDFQNPTPPKTDDRPEAIPVGPGEAPRSPVEVSTGVEAQYQQPQHQAIAEPWVPRSYLPPQNDTLLRHASVGHASLGLSPATDSGFHAGTSDLTGSFTPRYTAHGQTPQGQPSRQKGWDGQARPLAASVVIAWTVFAILIVGFTIVQHLPRPERQAADVPAEVQSPLLRFIGRYAVGAKQLVAGVPGQADQFRQMMSQIDGYVTNPTEQLRAVMLAAELGDADDALERLDAFPLQGDESLDDDARTLRKIYTAGVDAVDAQKSSQLIQNHRWFGKLAMSFELDDKDPFRKKVLEPTMSTITGALMMFMVGGLTAVLGLVLLILAIVWIVKRRLRSGYLAQGHRLVGARSAYLESLILFFVGMVGVRLLAGLIVSGGGPDVGDYLVWLLMLTPLWPLLRGVPMADLKKAYGWQRGGGVFKEAGCGVAGYIAGLPILFVGVILVLILQATVGPLLPASVSFDSVSSGSLVSGELVLADGMKGAHPVVFELAEASPWKLFHLFLLLCVWAPVLEETIFRGALYHVFRRRLGMVVSAVLVGLIFAAIHPQGIIAVPVLAALAFNFAMVREWRGSLIGPIVMHAMNNGMAFTAMLLFLR